METLKDKQKKLFHKRGIDKYTITEKRTLIFDYVMNKKLPLEDMIVDKYLATLLHREVDSKVNFYDIDNILVKQYK